MIELRLRLESLLNDPEHFMQERLAKVRNEIDLKAELEKQKAIDDESLSKAIDDDRQFFLTRLALFEARCQQNVLFYKQDFDEAKAKLSQSSEDEDVVAQLLDDFEAIAMCYRTCEFTAYEDITNLFMYSDFDDLESTQFQVTNSLGKLLIHEHINNLTRLAMKRFHGQVHVHNGYLRILGGHISTISASCFTRFPHTDAIKCLLLSCNETRRIESGVFAAHALPHLTALHLNSNELGHVQRGLFASLTCLAWLDLSRNKIERIEEGAFPRSLTQLMLNNNQMQSLDEHALKGLTNLHTLDVAYNRIQRLDANCFRDQSSLDTLILMHNEIAALPVTLFRPLASLKLLNLSHNALRTIERETFWPLARVTSLSLGRNLIEELSAETFRECAHLIQLGLGKNALRTLHVDLFAGLVKLKQLSLTVNKLSLSELHEDTFRDLRSLGSLALNRNEPDTPVDLDMAVFQKLKSLQQLEMIGCKLRGLTNYKEIGTEKVLPSLKKLALADNAELDKETIAFLQQSTTFKTNLRNNWVD